jgi:hypothetical protein
MSSQRLGPSSANIVVHGHHNLLACKWTLSLLSGGLTSELSAWKTILMYLSTRSVEMVLKIFFVVFGE